MKVLAIRGRNLASLAGDFEIRLGDGPLAEAGVFAICGPTGAGKSTLLDAMCLALYDTAPRVDGRSRVRVGREGDVDGGLTATDPRSILRKGVGGGYAEVDFCGVDGGVYRARWEVRRARDRPDGRLQPATLRLEALGTSSRWQGTKTEVKAEIERRLGLSYDQFRRSVLLAQGDFAAFLEADPKDRAELLERMTGTAIYGAISVEAHRRAAEERAALAALERRLDSIELLDEPARDGLLAERERLLLQVRHDELAKADIEAALRWHHELDVLARERSEAREAQEAIKDQLAVWETRRLELAAFEAVRPVRAAYDPMVAARAAHAQRARSAELATCAAEAAAAAEAKARAASATAATQHEAEVSRIEQTREAVARARALDEQLGRLSPATELASHRARSAAEQVVALAERLAASRSRQVELQEKIASITQWLKRDGAEELAREWPRTEEQLKTFVSVQARWIEGQARLEALGAEAREAAREEAAAAGRLVGLEWKQRELAVDWERSRALTELAPADALVPVRERWVARRTELETLVGVADKAQEAHIAERRHRERARRAERAIDEAQRAADVASRAGELRAVAQSELEVQRDRVRAALDLSARRAELAEGKPCPLCGSEDHPFTREAPALDELLDQVDRRLQEVRDEVRRLRRDEVVAREEITRSHETSRHETAEAERWSAALSEARERYREVARKLRDASAGGPGGGSPWPEELAEAPGRVAGGRDWGPLFALADAEECGALLSEQALVGLKEARAEAVSRLSEVEREERERRGRERTADRLREALDNARQRAQAAREQRTAADHRLRVAESQLNNLREQQRGLDGERERLREALGPSLRALAPSVPSEPCSLPAAQPTSWFVAACAAPRRFLDSAREAAAAWASRADELKALTEEAQSVVASCSRAAAEYQAARGRLADAEAAEAAARAAEAEATRARTATLTGDADEADAAARARFAASVDVLSRAREQSEAASAEAVRAAVGRDRADEELAAATAELRRTERRFAWALEEAQLDAAAAAEWLRRDPAEMRTWGRELSRLDRDRAEADAVLAERSRKHALHLEADPPAIDAAAARVQREAAERAVAATRELLHAARGRLERDDVERAAAETLRAEVETARSEVQVWLTLADLVGSASGMKLRVFAQSLTLELVLEHANHHLRELAPRYALERVAGEDLDLQVVDHSMGDEARAVGSLSGGESFLVSLGMALGLASLSTQRARVDSLFIDEGFGALDSSSLETVLSTLDALQATGRQVGLISHVPMVAERFETRVQVVADGPARSRVTLIGGG